MVHIFSTMLPLGSKASDFELTDVVSGTQKSLQELKSDTATVILFICNHCPYVKHYNEEISKLSAEYLQKGIAFVAISSNNAESFPNDAPEKLKSQAIEFGFRFPYLYDVTQKVAKAYKAACTPDFYIFDEKLKLVYRGQLDDSRPNNDMPITGKDLRDALEAIIKGHSVNSKQLPSSGCNIKWKAGVSPF